ncbi:MAG: imidazole glycerol phosphate synthase subunit HisH [Bacteroidales bacterium]
MKKIKDITIIDYDTGNLQSVCYALDRIGASYELTSDPAIIKKAHRVLLPGVGEASSAMRILQERGLDHVIKDLSQPVLGICLGMQLMCAHSEEGDVECLHIFPNQVQKFPLMENIKVPHVGWNTIGNLKSPLLIDLAEECYMYFTHSFYVEKNEHTIATCNHGIDFSACIAFNNFYGCQFHPEKSGDIGEIILRNFIQIS